VKRTCEINPECEHRIKEQKPVSNRGYKMKAVCTNCKEVTRNNVFPATTFEGYIRRWVHDKLTDKNSKGKEVTQNGVGNYRSTPIRLYYNGMGRNTSYGTDHSCPKTGLE